MTTISDIGGGNNDFPDLISWGNARGSSTDLEIAHVYSDQFLTTDFDHRTDFTGGYEVVGMGNDFIGDFTDTGVIRITRDPAYTSWLIDDRTGRGHWRNLIIDCTDFNVVFRGNITRFEATRVGFRGNLAASFDEVSPDFIGVFNQCAFFTENMDAASFRRGQVNLTDCIAVGNTNTAFGTVRIREMTGTVTNTVAHERQGSLCFGADGSTVTGSGCVSTDNSATTLSIGSQDASLPTYFENVSTGDLRINSAGQTALPASLSWAFVSAGGVTAVATESSSDFSESSNTSISANISAQVTEINTSFSELSSATITNNLITLSVTEISQDFSESVLTSISGSLSAIVTELSQSFTESSTADISANISAVVTELAQDFDESAQVNLIGSFTVEVTETANDFTEACYIQLPVQRLIPRKVISVDNRSGSAIRVRRRSSVIRVR